MSHAIYVRDITEIQGSPPRLLAYAIEERQSAERVVRGIVRSYLDCGRDPIPDVYWFQDAKGIHELWVRPL